jgi:apolipoprotein N-acyltransferase
MAAGASGLLLAGAFPPLDAGVLAWIALVPLLWAIRGQTPAGAFWLGLVTGFLWFALTLFWVTLFGLPAWLLLSAILSLYIGGFGALFRWLALRFPGRDLGLIPLAWTAVEVARSSGTLGFPWALLGATQHSALPVLQWAALGGVHLISLVIALGNGLLLAVIQGPRRHQGWVVASVLLLIAAVLGFGFWQLRRPLASAGRVAAIQPNIPPQDKRDVQSYQFQMSTLRRLTVEAAAGGADVIVFPETAVPANLIGSGGRAAEVGQWAPGHVVIASSQEIDGRGVRNFAAALSGSRVLGTYAKRRLVPFGEAGVTPGHQGDPIVTPTQPIGLLICYESAFEGLARRAAQQGATILAVLTNDGWFGQSAGPVQHAAYAVVRAVETGRTVVRAANTGISMVIDPHGRVLTRLPLGGEGVAMAAAALPVGTLYLRGGWLMAPGMLLLAGVLVVVGSSELLRAWPRQRALRRLAGTLLWPGIVAFIARDAISLFAGDARWWVPALLLTVVWLTAGRRGLGVRPTRAPVSALLGLAVVAVLGGAMVAAYRRYGFIFGSIVPAGGLISGGGPILLAALAQELWLRGAVFTAAEEWRGSGWAVIISTLPAFLLARGLTAEALIWSLFTGAIFGLIRTATGDALGLALPRAAGMVLVAALEGLRL